MVSRRAFAAPGLLRPRGIDSTSTGGCPISGCRSQSGLVTCRLCQPTPASSPTFVSESTGFCILPRGAHNPLPLGSSQSSISLRRAFRKDHHVEDPQCARFCFQSSELEASEPERGARRKRRGRRTRSIARGRWRRGSRSHQSRRKPANIPPDPCDTKGNQTHNRYTPHVRRALRPTGASMLLTFLLRCFLRWEELTAVDLNYTLGRYAQARRGR